MRWVFILLQWTFQAAVSREMHSPPTNRTGFKWGSAFSFASENQPVLQCSPRFMVSSVLASHAARTCCSTLPLGNKWNKVQTPASLHGNCCTAWASCLFPNSCTWANKPAASAGESSTERFIGSAQAVGMDFDRLFRAVFLNFVWPVLVFPHCSMRGRTWVTDGLNPGQYRPFFPAVASWTSLAPLHVSWTGRQEEGQPYPGSFQNYQRWVTAAVLFRHTGSSTWIQAMVARS